ncbi:MAG: molecular chaperone DnaK, partial [Frankiales bacterium]|nr:molecular chaperone DnaK [Frankiales bacterium]
DDRKRREEAEARNTADGLVYQTEKFLAENGDKLDETLKGETQEALGELKAALGGSDIAAINAAASKVSTSSQKLGASLYENAQASAPSAGPAGDVPVNDDDVVDAEIVDEGEQA